MAEERTASDRQAHREKWVLRTLLLGACAAMAAAIVASIDDIRRYVRMQQM